MTPRNSSLDASIFESLDMAREIVRQWLWQYHHLCPHASLKNQTPMAFLSQHGKYRFPTLTIDHKEQNYILERFGLRE
ncbi:MAG: integrase core domain-containing protein [Flavobacteriaceae bacterium]|nr:integrase core domain-containing protein [Flavobacteriaceae bacterium]